MEYTELCGTIRKKIEDDKKKYSTVVHTTDNEIPEVLVKKMEMTLGNMNSGKTVRKELIFRQLN